MTNDTQQSNSQESKNPAPFGTRLKSAREALGLERKDAAAQLRLNEKIILMMEKDRYPIDLPVTFIRGYIRSYGKLLQIPEYEIKKAIEPIKPKQTNHDALLVPAKQTIPMLDGNHLMQLITGVIAVILIGLVGIWWYSHGKTNPPDIMEIRSGTLPDIVNSPTQPTSAPMQRTATQTTTADTAAEKVRSTESNNIAQVDNKPNAQTSSTVDKSMPAKNMSSAIDQSRSQARADVYSDADEFEAMGTEED